MSKRVVHSSFLSLLGFIVLITVWLHLFTDLMAPGSARILGAAVSQLLLWGIAYRVCLGRPSGLLLGLGVAAVLLARLTTPLVGWALLVVLLAVRYAADPRPTTTPESGTGTDG